MNKCIIRNIFRFSLITFLCAFFPFSAIAKVERIDITSREIFADGHQFGKTGSYEKLVGTIFYSADPELPANAGIIDLDKADRGPDGYVHYKADLFILKPADLSKGNGAILYDVNNRGNKLALRFFSGAPMKNDPQTIEDSGDGYLFREGYTLVWSGWDGELLPAKDRLRLLAPPASNDGEPITDIVQAELFTNSVPEDEILDTLSISWPSTVLGLHGAYPPTESGRKNATLTWRRAEKDPRIPIPRSQWDIISKTFPEEDPEWTSLPQVTLRLPCGFRPGYLYELIYEAKNPVVMGLGFAAVRDLISYLRHETNARNPLFDPDSSTSIHCTLGFGVSQSGRFLRDFLYQGFNADENGRIVFDGLIPHVAGAGRGFFNARFAQPTRTNFQHDGHLYPIDRFPFTYAVTTDPLTGKTDGILRRAFETGTVPYIMNVNTSADYWTRGASLSHTHPGGNVDAVIPKTVRFYALLGTSHSPSDYPARRSTGQQLNNPANYAPLLKALLAGLNKWVRGEGAPPPSAYPRFSNNTLASYSQDSTGFPYIPGVRYPEVIQQSALCDYGPHFEQEKIITIAPPTELSHYNTYVPRCDRDGNPIGGIRLPDLEIPLATFTGWNLRNPQAGADNELVSMNGSYIPFPKTKKERQRLGDPRPSIEERYTSFQDYVEKYKACAKEMVNQGYLLEEDIAPLVKEREQFRELFIK